MGRSTWAFPDSSSRADAGLDVISNWRASIDIAILGVVRVVMVRGVLRMAMIKKGAMGVPVMGNWKVGERVKVRERVRVGVRVGVRVRVRVRARVRVRGN